MWDNTDTRADTAYSDPLTDLGFFIVALVVCAALGVLVWMILS